MTWGGSRNESELRIDLFNGSRIQIFGADNPDSIRGMGFDGVVLDNTQSCLLEYGQRLLDQLLLIN